MCARARESVIIIVTINIIIILISFCFVPLLLFDFISSVRLTNGNTQMSMCYVYMCICRETNCILENYNMG